MPSNNGSFNLLYFRIQNSPFCSLNWNHFDVTMNYIVFLRLGKCFHCILSKTATNNVFYTFMVDKFESYDTAIICKISIIAQLSKLTD